jgi:transcriptional regulator GlxA family with amidase domain
MGRKRLVGILVFDGVTLLDVAGPSEVFTEANHFGADYQLVLYSADGGDVVSSTGMRFSVDGAAADAAPLDIALVAGSDDFPSRPISRELVEAARTLTERARRTATICTGTFILAATGLLDGRRVTTHWNETEVLARWYPAVEVEPDAIYVEDGQIFSSAGVTAGIDLALALVELDYGAALARDVARWLVVFLQRPGGQSQFSPSLRTALPPISPLRQLCDTIAADPAGDYSLPKLASMANLSSRHLTRLFRDELKITHAGHVKQIRFDAAKDLLDAGHTVTDTAIRSGYGSPETLRNAFIQQLGRSPRAYQQRFQTAIRN